MSAVEHVILGVLTLGVVVYLVYALLYAERL
jgi:K+-transporting ATPase KdpF subunit